MHAQPDVIPFTVVILGRPEVVRAVGTIEGWFRRGYEVSTRRRRGGDRGVRGLWTSGSRRLRRGRTR
jgi:hypothetical protein